MNNTGIEIKLGLQDINWRKYIKREPNYVDRHNI